jgi:hypothetical protein
MVGLVDLGMTGSEIAAALGCDANQPPPHVQNTEYSSAGHVINKLFCRRHSKTHPILKRYNENVLVFVYFISLGNQNRFVPANF